MEIKSEIAIGIMEDLDEIMEILQTEVDYEIALAIVVKEYRRYLGGKK